MSEPVSPSWLDAGNGYELAIVDGALRCRNAKGKVLKSVPKAVAKSACAESLKALIAWLKEHERHAVETVEGWMLGSLPTPRDVLVEVLRDPAWRTPLIDAVVHPVDASGVPDPDGGGLLRAVDATKGLGVVTIDGETEWIDAPMVAVPHPMLVPELDDFRELATELGVTQGVQQLYRDTFPKPETLPEGANRVTEFADGRFEQLNHALGRARSRGFRVRGGFAVCPVIERARLCEARYWIGADAPDAEAYTGDLIWVDQQERPVALGDVGPVAFSEGMRMAHAIYSGRVVESTEEAS